MLVTRAAVTRLPWDEHLASLLRAGRDHHGNPGVDADGQQVGQPIQVEEPAHGPEYGSPDERLGGATQSEEWNWALKGAPPDLVHGNVRRRAVGTQAAIVLVLFRS